MSDDAKKTTVTNKVPAPCTIGFQVVWEKLGEGLGRLLSCGWLGVPFLLGHVVCTIV